VDRQLSAMVDSSNSVDRIILIPLGRTARLGDDLKEALMPLLSRTRDTASQQDGKGRLTISLQAEGDNVTGAALCALMELETTQVFRMLSTVIEGDQALHVVSKAQLRVIFDKIDVNGTDSIDVKELSTVFKYLGITRDSLAVQTEMDESRDGLISFKELMHWWTREVYNARVVLCTSADAWKRILMKSPPDGFGQLIVLEVAFTFCRACKAFERKFKRLADEFKAVRFIQLMGNGTIGSMELCMKELQVRKSPAFFIFRRGGEKLAQWNGTSVQTFQDELNRCLELVGEPQLGEAQVAEEPEVVPQTS